MSHPAGLVWRSFDGSQRTRPSTRETDQVCVLALRCSGVPGHITGLFLVVHFDACPLIYSYASVHRYLCGLLTSPRQGERIAPLAMSMLDSQIQEKILLTCFGYRTFLSSCIHTTPSKYHGLSVSVCL